MVVPVVTAVVGVVVSVMDQLGFAPLRGDKL